MLATIQSSLIGMMQYWLAGILAVGGLYALFLFLNKRYPNANRWARLGVKAVLILLSLAITLLVVLKISLTVFGVSAVFYVVYCWVASCYERAKKSTSKAKRIAWLIVGIPFYIGGGLLDIAYNATIATWPIFWEAPHQMTLTRRISRYKFDPAYAGTWRQTIGVAVCRILDPWQDGGHCSKP